MNKINYIIHLLLKDNDISIKVKNLQVNFNTLANSVNKVKQTVNPGSSEISGNITAVNTNIHGVNTPVEQTVNNIKYPLRRMGQVSDDPLPDYLGTDSLYSALFGNASCQKRSSTHGIS